MRVMGVGLVLVGLAVSGCTSVKMVQRDGCWVRQTTKWPNQVREELGVCARPEPKWADDRLSRLVQECMAQADYRWQNRALAAWNRGEPLPPQESEQEVLRVCMNEAATASVAENENLKTRVSELSADREALRAEADQDRTHLRGSHDRIAEALGEAAKKPAPAAVATATSNGTATTTSKTDQSSEPGQPVAIVAVPPAPAQVEVVTLPAPVVTATAPAEATHTPASCAMSPSPSATTKKASTSAKKGKSQVDAPACAPAKSPEPISAQPIAVTAAAPKPAIEGAAAPKASPEAAPAPAQ